MMMKGVRLAIACALVSLVSATYAKAQMNPNNRTVLTFSQPVEVPGRVLPAGTYTFELDDSQMNRHIVRIYAKNGRTLIATVLAVPDYRLKRTSKTVITFKEVAAGSPEAIRAWFFPGRTVGDELVYPKARATDLAAAESVPVPATDTTTDNSTTPETMNEAKIVAVAPDRTEEPLTAIQTTPPTTMATPPPEPVTPEPPTPPTATSPSEELPHTASGLPALELLGVGLLALGFSLRRIGAARQDR